MTSSIYGRLLNVSWQQPCTSLFLLTKFIPISIPYGLIHYIKCLRTLQHRYKHRPTQHTLNVINSLENSLQDKIKTAKQNYESNLITNNASINNSKYSDIWNPSQSLPIIYLLATSIPLLPTLIAARPTCSISTFILFSIIHHLLILIFSLPQMIK